MRTPDVAARHDSSVTSHGPRTKICTQACPCTTVVQAQAWPGNSMRKIIFCVATSLLRLLHVLDAAGCCLFSSVYLLFLLVRVALKRGLFMQTNVPSFTVPATEHP